MRSLVTHLRVQVTKMSRIEKSQVSWLPRDQVCPWSDRPTESQVQQECQTKKQSRSRVCALSGRNQECQAADGSQDAS